MRLVRFSLRTDKLPMIQIFLIGIVVGILGIYFGKSIFLDKSDFLDEATLYHLKYLNVDSTAYFYYVIRERMLSVVILAVLATTYLGVILCVGTAFWYGISIGAFLSAAILRYGLKGIFLVIVSAFPQYIIYVPMLFALLVWCERLCRGIYFQKSMTVKDANLLRIITIMLLMLVGCFLESFLNPHLLTGFLKIF